MSIQIGEQAERRQGRVRALASVSDRSFDMAVEPVARIALTQQEACASLGCSEAFSVEHVRPPMREARRGRSRLFPADELRREVARVRPVYGSERAMNDLDLTERLDRARERSRDDH